MLILYRRTIIFKTLTDVIIYLLTIYIYFLRNFGVGKLRIGDGFVINYHVHIYNY